MVWTHGHLFYSLGSNQYYHYVVQIFLYLATENPLSQPFESCPFGILLLRHEPGSSSVFPHSSSRASHFSKEPWFL